MSKYYVILNSGGDTYVKEFFKEELESKLDEHYWGDKIPLGKLHNEDTNYWGDNLLILKGEIVTPKMVTRTITHELP